MPKPSQPTSTSSSLLEKTHQSNHPNRYLLELKNLNKEYDGNIVLKNVSVTFNHPEFVSLLGPSGCGKTTLLRIIAGFETPNGGDVLFNGAVINFLPAHKRHINTVFQNYALFPHLNVFDNISYGLKLQKVPNIVERTQKMLRIVNMEGFEHKKIQELSGGQQQRVALARALAVGPEIILLDEPLSALDKNLRSRMQIELKKIQRETKILFIFVTHDQEEALSISDKIILINNGEIQQIGAPTEIYNEPNSTWVARFIGHSNIISGTFIKQNWIMFDKRKFHCQERNLKPNTNINILIRPEDIELVTPTRGYFQGVVRSTSFKGVHWEVVVKTEFRQYLVHTTKQPSTTTQLVGIRWHLDDIHLMPDDHE